MALGDLMASHLQIAQNIQAILMNDEKQKLSPQTQVETYFDLGVYFFSFNGFEKAYSCFSRASELVEDGENGDESMEEGGNVKLPADDRANLEGYLAACEAVLEVQSVNESPAVLKTPKMQIEMAWEGRDWDKVIQLLENDIVASDLMRLPQGYRAALEQQALRLLRSSSNNLMEDDPHVAAPTVRFFYKRIVVENAVNVLLLEGDQEEATSLETCVSVCIRQLQDEIFHSVAREASDDGEAKKRFVVLVRFILALSGFAYGNAPNDSKSRIKHFVVQILRHFPCISDFAGVSELLRRCGDLQTKDVLVIPFAESLESLVAVEGHLRNAVAKQRERFRLAANVGSLFESASSKEKDGFVGALQKELVNMPALKVEDAEEVANDNAIVDVLSRNLIMFCSSNNCWDMLSQCKTVAAISPLLRCELELVLACGVLTQYLSSLSASPVSTVSAKNSSGGGDTSLTPSAEKSEFSITKNNKLVATILLKWRELMSAIRADPGDNGGDERQIEDKSKKVFMDLPLWIVETLVCVSAGLLHRAYMRNACDYRVSFDLTPYGDLAFLEAFASDLPKTVSAAFESGSGETGNTEGADAQFATVPFLKNFQTDLVGLHARALESLACRCGREPRWHCAKADLLLNPLSKQRLASASDPRSALKGYLVAASLATNFFSDMVSVVDIIDQSSLVRLCFMPEEFKYGLRILRLGPESHDDAFFQYFWELPFLELLVDLHSSPKYLNERTRSTSNTAIYAHAMRFIYRCVLSTMNSVEGGKLYARAHSARFSSGRKQATRMASTTTPKNTLLGATNYEPRLRSHLKPQRFKLVQKTLRLDSTLNQMNPLTTRLDLRNPERFETTASDIGKMASEHPEESKFAPQNVQKVLRFHTFYVESVDESNLEVVRLRKNMILLYLHDETFEIIEPRVPNSGIPQGTFLKRCKLRRPDGEFYSPADLHLGFDLHVFGRNFKLYDCDEFTREYYAQRGEDVGPPLPLPKDEYTLTRDQITRMCGGDHEHFYGKQRYPLKTYMEASLGNPIRSRLQSEKKRKFLANNRKVLCFHCEYDVRDQLYGDLMSYTLDYFLEDDTMEFKEVSRPNNGRDPFPLLLRRARLLKDCAECVWT
ncbi:hypothetical protein ON010_g14537 [Phytophthora cinnamomi]|nr:hypothetical protein ON010_g14537 [Phytophthora cinnamomi]